MLEAGIDIDVSTLKLIGTRGLLIAVVGSGKEPHLILQSLVSLGLQFFPSLLDF